MLCTHEKREEFPWKHVSRLHKHTDRLQGICDADFHIRTCVHGPRYHIYPLSFNGFQPTITDLHAYMMYAIILYHVIPQHSITIDATWPCACFVKTEVGRYGLCVLKLIKSKTHTSTFCPTNSFDEFIRGRWWNQYESSRKVLNQSARQYNL